MCHMYSPFTPENLYLGREWDISIQGHQCGYSAVYHIPAFKPSLPRELQREMLENKKTQQT